MTSLTESPTVYVVQEMSNHDIASAMSFGQIQVLLPSTMQIAFSTAPAIRLLKRRLRSFSDKDFLLLTGDPVAIGLVCSIAAVYNSGRYTALKWDRREKLYIPVRLDITEKGETDD